MAILPLRLFLGITFIYGGLQKLSDPGFFKAGSPTYIGAQIISYGRGSPIRPILMHAAEHAVLAGALTIATELTIGLLVLFGLFTRLSAIVGMGLNLTFFLSASWHTYPYFMGSDIVFVMAWLTVALTGPGAYALDFALPRVLHHLFNRNGPTTIGKAWDRWAWLILGPVPLDDSIGEAVATPSLSSRAGGEPARAEKAHAQPDEDRRRTLTRREAVAGSLAAMGLVILGLLPRPSLSAGRAGVAAPGSGSSTGGTGSTTGGGGSTSVPAGAKKVGTLNQLKANQALMPNDPATGDPAVIVETSAGVVAYDAICTHAGCTVQYDPQQKLLVCPCHGGAYDPAKGAQVVYGPPPAPLTPLTVKVQSNGDIYLV
jgi:thiosulfate dehydrogenase [quinone] large subunit